MPNVKCVDCGEQWLTEMFYACPHCVIENAAEATKPGPLGSAVLPGWDERLSKAIGVVFKKMVNMTADEIQDKILEHAQADPDRAEAIRRAMVVDN